MKSKSGRLLVNLGAILALGISAQASTISVTYLGSVTGVNDGTTYVMPYQLSIDGNLALATCYDIFHTVVVGQSWTANELTLVEASTGGQFSGNANALAGYKAVGFLSQQAASSAQNQIDLQHNIWNVFAPGTYSVTAGMQAYLDLLATPLYSAFDFNKVRFLEDINPTDRAQAFVIDPPTHAPEPGTIVMMAAGALLLGASRLRARTRE